MCVCLLHGLGVWSLVLGHGLGSWAGRAPCHPSQGVRESELPLAFQVPCEAEMRRRQHLCKVTAELSSKELALELAGQEALLRACPLLCAHKPLPPLATETETDVPSSLSHLLPLFGI